MLDLHDDMVNSKQSIYIIKIRSKFPIFTLNITNKWQSQAMQIKIENERRIKDHFYALECPSFQSY